MATTALHLNGVMGIPHSFSPKTEAEVVAVEEVFSGGYFDGSERAPKRKSSYQIQMEGLAELPIINRHYPMPLQVDKLIDKVSIEEESEEEELKAIMLLIH